MPLFDSVTSKPLAVTDVVPVITMESVLVTAPPDVTTRFPVTILRPRAIAFLSTNVTFLPVALTAPTKSLLILESVMSW